MQYTSKGASARAGIDVSYSQGDIDWAAVAADGVDFAIIAWLPGLYPGGHPDG